VKILFADFSSAFNTVLPNVLVERLAIDFNLDGRLILWLRDILRNRVGETRDRCNTFFLQFLAIHQKPFILEYPICYIINFNPSTAETMY